jgi:hypothetical protein
MTNSNSHDYARRLLELATFLLSRDSFVLPYHEPTSFHHFRYYEKEPFVAAVRALGSGKKKLAEDSIEFVVAQPGYSLSVEAPRNLLCRLIRPAEYDCDPFLSPEEEKQLGGEV